MLSARNKLMIIVINLFISLYFLLSLKSDIYLYKRYEKSDMDSLG